MPLPVPESPQPLHDVASLRVLEARAIASLGGDGTAPMRRAGDAAWRCVLAHWPRVRTLLVCCGPGNNGGDGFVLAACARASGIDATVLRLPAHAPRTGEARRMEAEWREAGGAILDFDGALPPADVVVDALFGIGLDRAPDAEAAVLIDAINASAVPVLSLDVPSGIDATRGCAPATAVRATRTLQFIAQHAGLRTGDALEHGGALERATLDLDASVFDGIAAPARLWTRVALDGALPPRRRGAHKGDGGHVLCVGGDHGGGGAIALPAEASLRTGCGLASIATRGAHVAGMLARLPEAMVQAVEDIDADGGGGGVAALADHRAGVVVIGPGLGRRDWGRALFADALRATGRALVLDADALNLLAESPSPLPAGTVLTPHPGEAARLLGTDTATVQRDRFAAVRALRDRFDATIVLKGAGTLVASPGSPVEVIGAGNPGMAVGGMGDVLAGVVASLRAQGLDAHAAAHTAALLHACAGDVAAADGGPRGLLPSDLMAPLRALANA